MRMHARRARRGARAHTALHGPPCWHALAQAHSLVRSTVAALQPPMAAIDERLDAAAKAELDEHGMTIIEDLLTSQQTAKALRAIQNLFAAGHAEDQHKGIHYTMNLTARDEIFREIVTLPRLVSLEAHLLGDDYILSGA